MVVLDIENSGCGDPFWKATLKYVPTSCCLLPAMEDLLIGCVDIQHATSSILIDQSSIIKGSAATKFALKKNPAHPINLCIKHPNISAPLR